MARPNSCKLCGKYDGSHLTKCDNRPSIQYRCQECDYWNGIHAEGCSIPPSNFHMLSIQLNKLGIDLVSEMEKVR